MIIRLYHNKKEIEKKKKQNKGKLTYFSKIGLTTFLFT